MAELDVELSDWVKKGRTAKGWTQAQLAKAVGSNVRTVRHWERGETTPRPEVMERVQEVLGPLPGTNEMDLPGGEWVDLMGGGRVPFPAGVIEAGEQAVLKAVMARGRGMRGMAMAVVDKSQEARKALKERTTATVVVADGDAWVLGTMSEGRTFRRSGGTLTSKLPVDAEVLPVVAVFEAMA